MGNGLIMTLSCQLFMMHKQIIFVDKVAEAICLDYHSFKNHFECATSFIYLCIFVFHICAGRLAKL